MWWNMAKSAKLPPLLLYITTSNITLDNVNSGGDDVMMMMNVVVMMTTSGVDRDPSCSLPLYLQSRPRALSSG